MIKETCNGHCVIREFNYGASFGKITRLVNEAKADFPSLGDDDIKVVFYGGERYRRTLGIEFDVTGDIPEAYTRITELEYTL